jgi:hypothetical protein
MKSDRKNLVRVSIAGILTAVGVLIAVFHASIFDAYLLSLPPEERIEVFNGRSLYLAVPLGIGFVLFLIGVFNLFYGPAWGSLPRRLLSFLPSSKLLGTLFLFLLPWFNIQCHGQGKDGRLRSDLRAYQTGLQAAYGGYTAPYVTPQESKSAPQPRSAPLVADAGLAALIGVVGGLLLRRRLPRFPVLPACSLVAFLLLLAQSQGDLPIKAWVDAENRNPFLVRSGPPAPGPPELVLEYTCWYYAAIALPLAAALSSGADWLVNRRRPAVQFHKTVVLREESKRAGPE